MKMNIASKILLWLALELKLVVHGKNESTRLFNQEIVRQYQSYCPYTDQCHTRANQTFIFDGYDQPCCGFCLCDDDCKHNYNCCPDMVDQFVTADEIESIKADVTECVYAQFRAYHLKKDNGEAYTMVSKCPADYKDKDVVDKCLRDYEQFNFDEQLSYLPPMSSFESEIIFKNYHCAICNGVDMHVLHFWRSQLKCTKYPIRPFADVREIPKLLDEESTCQVEFIPPINNSWTKDKECWPLVDRCNVTGRWMDYDFQLEAACLSYKSEYKGYKNVHCFLCNGYNVNDMEYKCEGLNTIRPGDVTFLALIDFNDKVPETLSSSIEQQPQCERSSVYDVKSKICRQMVCPKGFILNGRNCASLFKYLASSRVGIIVEVPFILIPVHVTEDMILEEFNNIALMLASTSSRNIGLIRSADASRIWAFNVYIKLKFPLEDMLDSMILTNDTNIVPYVSHLEVMMQIEVNGVEDINDLVKEISRLFIENEYFNQFYIRHKQVGYKYDEMEKSTKDEIRDKIHELGRTIGSLPGPDVYTAIVDGFNDPKDGLGVMVVSDFDYTSPLKSTIIVQPDPFCPRVELTHDEFKINTIMKSATRRIDDTSDGSIGTIYNFSNVVETTSGDGVLVCVDEFLTQTSEHMDNNDVDLIQAVTEKSEEEILTIVCLVVSLASLVLTVIVYCILPRLRTLPGMNVMALSVALIIFYALTLSNSLKDIPPLSIVCKFVGIFQHFSLLYVFSWMLICTYHMMRVFSTIKERSEASDNWKLFIRYILFALIVPILLVGVTIIVSVLNYNRIGYGGKPCYIKSPTYILYSVVIPLAVVVISNIVMFSIVAVTVMRMPQIASSTKKERNNLLIFLKLSTLTGFAWIFGILYQFSEVMLLAYLFIICNAGQGVFIMLSFVANEQVFRMLRGKVQYISENKPKSVKTEIATVDSTTTASDDVKSKSNSVAK